MDRPTIIMHSTSTAVHHMDDLCVVSPSPELEDKLKEQFENLIEQAPESLAHRLARRSPHHVGLNDGLIFPGTYYPTGTTAAVAQRAALDRAPLHGTLRVIVVLVDFTDRVMAAGARDRLQNLFFSTGAMTHGSVTEYFKDVSGNKVDITGQVVGPYRMPRPLADYAGSDNGLQGGTPNARTLANDALSAANPHVNFGPYDNDGNGYVDAFIVVHAGRGAEETGATGDIWSHKWVLPAERTVDGTKVFAYLTIPEDAKLGVSAHELGHLLFGWPDLYDTDGSSSGVGNWCLMGSGSWGLGGDRPVHPSAWCKINQGWATSIVQTANATVTIQDVKTSGNVYRLWKDGAGGNEYFLVENRQQAGFDASMPGGGLLVWHIDEAIGGNSNENHPKVALEQADGNRNLEAGSNRGDAGDSFPGSQGVTSFTASSTPNSKSYAGSDTCVSIKNIPASSAAMTVTLGVRCAGIGKLKDTVKDIEKLRKEIRKELIKEKELKENRKEFIKEAGEKDIRKEVKELKEKDNKEIIEDKRIDNGFDDPFGRRRAGSWISQGQTGRTDEISARVAHLEATLQLLIEALSASPVPQEWDTGDAGPFIGGEERPDLGHTSGGPDAQALRDAMGAGSAEAKSLFDNLPPQQ